MNYIKKMFVAVGIIVLGLASVAGAAFPQMQFPSIQTHEMLKSAIEAQIPASDIHANMAIHHAPEFVPDEILVKFKGSDRFVQVGLLQNESVDSALARYKKFVTVEAVEPNYIAHAFSVPNDPYFKYQWDMNSIQMPNAWNVSTGAGVTIAVIDTGVAYENYSRYYKAPDLANTAFVPGYNFVSHTTHANDDEGHGTHVTGTLAQSTNNATGVAGIAYQARIMPIKVLDRYGSGTYQNIADGIRWAADHGAKVINMSLGGPAGSQALQDAVKYAYDKGVVVVAAAGNDGTGTVSYPAAYSNYVISVGATRFDNTKAPYSNYGPGLALVAPGGDMNVDQNGDGYGDGILQQTFGWNYRSFGYYFYQGTSMASPHVAGVAALLISHGNATTTDQVRRALQETATDLGAPGYDQTYGYGLINASAALGWVNH